MYKNLPLQMSGFKYRFILMKEGFDLQAFS